jgi:hypothetical protein
MRFFFTLVICSLFLSLHAQNGSDSLTKKPSPARKWLIGGGSAVAIGTILYGVNHQLYSGVDKSGFYTTDDRKMWLQMDKLQHATIGYVSSSVLYAGWKWAGLNRKQATLAASLSALLMMTSKEIMDGTHVRWGWSWLDMGANVFGTGLFASQQIGWGEQKIRLKFSAHLKDYDPSLQARVNNAFGENKVKRIIKDYNGQIYWLSVNPASLFHIKFPRWLNIAAGYGAEGMFNTFNNIVTAPDGTVVFDRSDIPRYRQFYIAPDIDFSRIPVKSRFLKAVFSVVNIKMPAPGLEFSNGSVKFLPIAY